MIRAYLKCALRSKMIPLMVLLLLFLINTTGCQSLKFEDFVVSEEELPAGQERPVYRVTIAENYLLLENKNTAEHLIPLDLMRIAFGKSLDAEILPVKNGQRLYIKKEALKKIPRLEVFIEGSKIEMHMGPVPDLPALIETAPGSTRLNGYLFLVNREYPLAPDFANPGLAPLDSPYVHNYHADMLFEKYAAEMLGQMASDFYQQTGRKFINISTYRTFEHQERIFNSRIQMNRTRFGMSYQEAFEKAAKIVAIPGTSEHQSGLAIDFTTQELLQKSQPLVEGFANTIDGQWLKEYAAGYGFILSFPKDKTEITSIVYEPWHYRYVGLPHSKIIMEKQIVLSEYLEMLEEEKLIFWNGYTLYYLDPSAWFTEQIRYSPEIMKVESDNRGGAIITVNDGVK